MAACLILMQQVDDVDRYRSAHLPGLRPFLRKHGAEVLAGGSDHVAGQAVVAPGFTLAGLTASLAAR